MVTRPEFPYLQELLINDAYAVKNLRVPVFEPGQEFKHLVLTGRNGSGKTTVLRALNSVLDSQGCSYYDGCANDREAKVMAHFIGYSAKSSPFTNFLSVFGAPTITAFYEASRISSRIGCSERDQ